MDNKVGFIRDTSRRSTKRQIARLIVGLIVFVFVTTVAAWFTTISFLIPVSVTYWLSQTKYPLISLWMFSITVACSIRILIWLGVKIPLIKEIVESANGQKWDFALGLPIWVAFILGAVSVLVLIILKPFCTSPVVLFNSEIGSEVQVFEAGDLINYFPNSTLTLMATSPNDEILNCSWSYVGNPILSISSSSDCVTTLYFSDQPGSAFLTLTAKKGFCRNVTVAPLEILILEK